VERISGLSPKTAITASSPMQDYFSTSGQLIQ
jgi:hypothetical protein